MFKIISLAEKHCLEQVLSSMITNFLPQSSVVSLPQSSIVFNPEMLGPSISLSGLQHLQNICDDYAAEHNIAFNRLVAMTLAHSEMTTVFQKIKNFHLDVAYKCQKETQ